MPAKGQHLYIRPIAEGDRAAITEFLRNEAGDCPLPERGLLGRLVGDLVAVAGARIEAEEVHLEVLLVAKALRRKRIGRVMIDALAASEAGSAPSWLVARKDESTLAFFRRVGFSDRGDSVVRRIGSGSDKVAL